MVNVEDELTRLFTDDRLDVPVRPGAQASVLAGAQRRRNRRRAAAVTCGSLAVVAVAVVGVAIGGAGPARHDTLPAINPPATSALPSEVPLPGPPPVPLESGAVPPPTITSAPSSRTGAPSSTRSPSSSTGPVIRSVLRAASTDPTIGPAGWGRLTLGMAERAAVATDEFDVSKGYSGSPCHRYWLRNGGNTPVDVSPTAGVARIDARPGVTTPEGLGPGSTDEQVLAAYPKATVSGPTITAPVPGNNGAVYVFNTDATHEIVSLRLELARHNC